MLKYRIYTEAQNSSKILTELTDSAYEGSLKYTIMLKGKNESSVTYIFIAGMLKHPLKNTIDWKWSCLLWQLPKKKENLREKY